jgi:hypothetical protein
MSKVYLPVHLLPFLFRLRRLKTSSDLQHPLLGYLRSLLFAGVYVACAQLLACYFKPLRGGISTGLNPVLAIFICGSSLIFEP